MPELRKLRVIPLADARIGFYAPDSSRNEYEKQRRAAKKPPPKPLTKRQLARLAARELPDTRVHGHPEQRYHVHATTGYGIHVNSPGQSGSRRPSTSYTVLDSCYGKVIAIIEPQGLHSGLCLKRATKLCDELNADEDAWLEAGE